MGLFAVLSRSLETKIFPISGSGCVSWTAEPQFPPGAVAVRRFDLLRKIGFALFLLAVSSSGFARFLLAQSAVNGVQHGGGQRWLGLFEQIPVILR